MIKKSGQMGVPVIDIDGKIIVGFDQAAIEKALKKWLDMDIKEVVKKVSEAVKKIAIEMGVTR